MKVRKHLIGSNKKVGIVSDIFDKLLKKFHPGFLSKLDFYLEEKEEVTIDNNEATIYLNYSNPFIQNEDKRAIRILVLRQLFRIEFRRVSKLPIIIEDILINRKLIKMGYGNDLFYYYYLIIMEYETSKINEIETFLKLSIPWVSFSTLDSYSSNALKKLVKKLDYEKIFEEKTEELFSSLEKDLMVDNNLETAIGLYKETGVKYPDN